MILIEPELEYIIMRSLTCSIEEVPFYGFINNVSQEKLNFQLNQAITSEYGQVIITDLII